MLASEKTALAPAFLVFRRWTLRMEADISDWTPQAVPPLALAMRYNNAILAFKAEGNPGFGQGLAALSPMLACNTRLVSLALERTNGTPNSVGSMCAGLVQNPMSALSVINLNDNDVGDAGAMQLAAALARHRTGLLAELKLKNARIGAGGMDAVLKALYPKQFNLLQLDLSGNTLAGAPSATLAFLLPNLRKLEELSIGGSQASVEQFGAIAPGSLKMLRKLDLSALAWSPSLLALINACGKNLASAELSRSACNAAPTQRRPNATPPQRNAAPRLRCFENAPLQRSARNALLFLL